MANTIFHMPSFDRSAAKVHTTLYLSHNGRNKRMYRTTGISYIGTRQKMKLTLTLAGD